MTSVPMRTEGRGKSRDWVAGQTQEGLAEFLGQAELCHGQLSLHLGEPQLHSPDLQG